LPGPLAAAVARAALGAGRADLLAALAAHPSREVAKEARRGLHLLRARGVDVPEPSRPAPPPAAPAEEPPLPAYASAIDGHGERAVWLPRAVPGKGIEVGQAVISDERGLLELQLGLVGRREWRAVVRDLVARGEAMGVGEIDGELARSLVAAARARNDASGTRVPEGADRWLAQLGPAAPPRDPADRFPALPEEEEREALAASAALHDLPLLRGWLPEEAFLREVAAQLDEVAVSALYIDERQRREQAARLVAQAVERYLSDGARRTRLVGRLCAAADHLDRTGDAARARAAAAAARALAAGAPPLSIPFARRLVEKAFPIAPEEAASPRAEPLVLAPR
ncbi:MAG TPA: hypothetical protein VLS93_10125, partial [Anaeromyxobacteraceae bacterium]|nr:hypothetical protein [Anaeromyxobacteraceae bacterium]